jgi:hypothetical protein
MHYNALLCSPVLSNSDQSDINGDQHLSLLDITVLGPVQINPHRDQSMATTYDLCSQYGVGLADMHRYTSMSSYLFPSASQERLISIDLLNAVLFYIDDVYDRNADGLSAGHDPLTADVYHNCIDIFVHGRMPAQKHRLYPIWQELHRRFHASSSTAYLQRLTQSLVEHFQATGISNDAFTMLGDERIHAYIDARTHDSGMYPTVLLIEFAAALELDSAVQTHPVIIRATYLTVVVAALLNDLFSYEKEVIQLGSRFNLVNILMDTQQISFESAVHRSVLFINRLIADFQAIDSALPVWAEPELNQQARLYVDGLRDQIIAAWHWQLNTNRYRSSESPFEALRMLLPE